MNKQQKKMVTLLLVVALIGTAVYVGITYAGSQLPPLPDPDPIDIDGDGIPDVNIALTAFQALRVIYTDGSDRWYYPNTRTVLEPYVVGESLFDSLNQKQVASTQAYVYFNLQTDLQASNVVFVGGATIYVMDTQGNLVKQFPEQLLDYAVPNPQNGVDQYVMSATITANDIQALSNVSPNTNYYWVISMRDLGAGITFSNGMSTSLASLGSQNVDEILAWRFQTDANTMSVISTGVEWK